MTMMRGVVFVGNGRVQVREFPRPRPTGTQVLIELKVSGLCGSDMHPFRNPPEYWAEAPIIRGHEPSGVVAEVGEAVSMVKVGERVSVYHAPTCNHCEACARGEYFNCTTIGPGYRLASMQVHGADADHLLVDQNVCLALPDTLSFEDGSIIACAGGTVYHALRRGDVHAAEVVLISGLGPVGLCAVKLARAMGGMVIGSDPVAYRRALALQQGANVTIDPTQGPLAEQVKAIAAKGAEVVIETSGNDQARVDVVPCTPYHARLVYVGWGGNAKNATLGPMLGERWITGSNMFTAEDYYTLVRFMSRTGLHLSDLITHRFPLESAQEAFDTFATRETGKVVFIWD